ncbi:hypothetical protein LIT25_08940 [Bacillus sp. F19]|nr:hypothetical protein LIT25_08940 [Bacillus sp. F19]
MEQKNGTHPEKSASKWVNGAEKSSPPRKKCVKEEEWSRKMAFTLKKVRQNG